MALEKLYIVCAEAGCGAEVDVVEYDADAAAPAVVEVMNALGWPEDKARKLVKAENPGAELRSADAGKALADAIVAKAVPDRDEATYRCPRGHTGALGTSRTRPAPAEVFAIVQIPAEQADGKTGDNR